MTKKSEMKWTRTMLTLVLLSDILSAFVDGMVAGESSSNEIIVFEDSSEQYSPGMRPPTFNNTEENERTTGPTLQDIIVFVDSDSPNKSIIDYEILKQFFQPTTPDAHYPNSGENDEMGGSNTTLSNRIPVEPEETDCQSTPVDENVDREGRRVSDIMCEINKRHALHEQKKNNECSGIVGGRNTAPGTFPHTEKNLLLTETKIGAVGWESKNGYEYFCGTTLISSEYSLTAAHCNSVGENLVQWLSLNSSNASVVAFGGNHIKDLEITKIKRFIIVEEYKKNPILTYNDIALIQLAEPVSYSLYILPACLWRGHLGEIAKFNVTGWGQTLEDNHTSRSNELQFGVVDFVEANVCWDKLKDFKNRKWAGLKDHQFCAGRLQGAVDTCQGDSGGPIQFMQPINSDMMMNYVVGVTGFGFGCAKGDLPSVYTNVTSYLCWIEKIVWPMEQNPWCTNDTVV